MKLKPTEGYDKLLEKTEQEEYKDTQPERLALGLIKLGSKVLSCGCGSGREVKFLVRLGCEVTAIEKDKRKIKLSKKIEPNAIYYKTDMVTFDKEKEFDYITCLFNTINELKSIDERRSFISNCYGLLKKGGKLLITTTHMFSDLNKLKRKLFGKVDSKQDRYYFPSQINRWFQDTEFKVSKIKINRTLLIIAEK